MRQRILTLAMAGLLGACSVAEDERGSTGVPTPAAAYCTGIGHTLAEGQCVFPDGASCEQWAFYRAECGAAHSYCNLHGGSITSTVTDMGTWTSAAATCVFPDGRRCLEDSYWRTGKCP